MEIDEQGLHKLKGRNETDHNTIIVNLNINSIDRTRTFKRTDWNLRASNEKWAEYERMLSIKRNKATEIITRQDSPLDTRYNKWFKEIEEAARRTIGKTTFKQGKKEKYSIETMKLSDEKKKLKERIQKEENDERKKLLITEYKTIQERMIQEMTKEKAKKITHRFEKIMEDRSKNAFWKEKKKMTRSTILEYLIIKNEQGERIFDPKSIMEETAKYYQNLYKEKPLPYHTYHMEVKNKMIKYTNERDHEELEHNNLPTEKEIHEIINNKPNGKSTTDIRNEMLKRPGINMTRFIYPMIKTIWNEEEVPRCWTKGNITSIYKGKGDREMLKNHRGITTSSAVGTIFDAWLDKQIETKVPFTQAQGGGRKGASTCDHLFLIRAIIEITLKEKRSTFLTFYDVSKAYDNAD